MTRRILLLLTLFCCTFTFHILADTWEDPTWKRMLDGSDVIALIQYTGDGDFRAPAKILRSYKGGLIAGNQIWISGFSSRYGPTDVMRKGDRYVVFLNLHEPNDKGIEYFTDKVKGNPDLRGYIEAYKKKKAYLIWTPTAGDLKVHGNTVQYTLIQTTFSGEHHYSPIREFERFLLAYFDKSKTNKECQKLLAAIHPATASDLNAQNLMKLFLLGYDRYENIFGQYLNIKNLSSKYALALLMGNIKSEESRNVLIALLDEKESILQGEAVRQLKMEPTAIIAPILLRHLKTSGHTSVGPSNLMEPVLNRFDGGKAEIIKTLGELKYQPAIPDLLALLDTEDEDYFMPVIDALKKIGSKEYIHYINNYLDHKSPEKQSIPLSFKPLDRKSHELIDAISSMIAHDGLAECLLSFKTFISTHNRNTHPGFENTISAWGGIGHFNDSSTVSFLLNDYKRFLTYQHTLDGLNQYSWTNAYIETFTDLKCKEARPLIYRSIYDWWGLSEAFGRNPRLFEIKKHLEDTLRIAFANILKKKGYQLNNCMAFIENSGEVAAGQQPVVHYLVEVTIPSTDRGNEHRAIIANELQLPREKVSVRFINGVYYLDEELRLNQDMSHSPLFRFLNYAKAIPNPSDISFLQSLLDSNFFTSDYDVTTIKKTIDTIKKALH